MAMMQAAMNVMSMRQAAMGSRIDMTETPATPAQPSSWTTAATERKNMIGHSARNSNWWLHGITLSASFDIKLAILPVEYEACAYAHGLDGSCVCDSDECTFL